jgi:hypothetical protein
MVPFSYIDSIFFFYACILALSRVEPLLSLAAEFAASFILRYIHSLFVHAYYPYPTFIEIPPEMTFVSCAFLALRVQLTSMWMLAGDVHSTNHHSISNTFIWKQPQPWNLANNSSRKELVWQTINRPGG